jgi:hypothetical protein
MSRSARGVALATATAAGVGVARILLRRTRRGWPASLAAGGREPRWHTVTIHRPPEQVAPDGGVPEPLGLLGDAVEVPVRPAPGSRGTELAARLRDGASVPAQADDLDTSSPVRALRSALRHAKQLAETGEVLAATEPGTSRRTLLNRPLEAVTRHGRGEGRL